MSIISILFRLFLVLQILIASSGLTPIKKKNNVYSSSYFEQGIKLHLAGKLKEAVVAFNNALALEPNDAATLTELGELYIQLSNYDLARATLKQASNIAPDDALIYVLLGNAYLESKKYNDAISSYRQAITLEPENTLLRSNLGLSCFLAADYKCAVENLGKVVIMYPYQLRARAALGNAYHSIMDYSLAQEQYKFVLNYEGLNINLLHNLAKSQIALAELEEAKITLDKAISIDSSVVDLYLDRAFVLDKLTKLNDAEADYLYAVKLEPLNPEIPVEYASFLWRTGNYERASEIFDKALELNPSDKELLLYKAYMLQLSKKDEKAVASWLKLLEKDPENETVYFNLAKIYQAKNEYHNAINYYRKLIELQDKKNKYDLEVKASLAYCSQMVKNYSEAKILYESILRETPNDSNILYNLGVLLSDEGNPSQAISYLESAINNNFSYPSKVYKALADVYVKVNDNSNLLKTYKSWLEIDKNNIEARISYAKFLSAMGNKQEAIDQFRLAAALDNSSITRFKLAQFLLEQKDFYGALGQLQEFLKFEPSNLNALMLLANAFKYLGVKEQAINTYMKVISLQFDNYLAYYNLGLLYHEENKNEEAKNAFLKAIEINNKYAAAYYALGLSYMSANDKGKARESFEKYLQIEPQGEYKENVEAKLKELSA
ncbi:MAG: hypothetical protein A3B68_04140 [Candidatus Melainabacteria bacterium RIFCSPHIGHO2_02_FULL_34_12]|nr:MAG: hypothetical protein A3B68_04140 [Candidatus Melainabacteria bacterium RIFCSPHIGHO2_02_FULL_34_12]